MTPDNWVVVKLKGHYRLLVGWSGGYTTGGSWRLSSDLATIEDAGDSYTITTLTGSVYSCYKGFYCLRMNNAYIWRQLEEQGATLLEKTEIWNAVPNT
jgi:hypothetical protein